MIDFLISHPSLLMFAGLALFAFGAIGFDLYTVHIRPLFIPRADIDRIADDLIARFGEAAAECALGEEQRAAFRCESIEEGKWRRVRRVITRRRQPRRAGYQMTDDR